MDGLLQLQTIDSATALKLATAGREYAVKHGFSVSIAVVDIVGNLVAYSQSDGAPVQCVAIACDKAKTAATFGITSRQLGEGLTNEAPRVSAGLVTYDGLALFGGGAPVMVDGKTVGAVGVSGASEAEDEECALGAINAVFGDRD